MSASNITSWADASSDSESEDERIAPPPSNLPGSASYAALQAAEEAEIEEEEPGFPGRRLEDMPSQPPYTAFVGNLHKGMEKEDFRGEMERMLEDRGCQTESGEPVKIAGARLINDRATGQSKGFGYVEFGTPEELLAFLNMGYYQISGRNLKVDIASGERQSRGGGGGGADRRRSGRGGGGRGEGRNYDRQYSNDSYRSTNRDDTPIDGSQFQGGRYSRSASNASQGSIGGGGGRGMPRNGSGMMARSDSSASAGSISQRPSLKLAPRTKPLEESGGSSRSSIFGDAKPRDEKEFEEKKAAEAAEKEERLKKVTSSMGDLEVVNETNGNDEKDTDDKDGDKPEKSGETKTLNRKPSRGAGRGGDRPERNNSDRRRDGRKSGRGEGRGEGRGGRGDRRNSERGGRTSGKESGKRPSAKSNGKSGEVVSSLSAAAAMPVKQETKAPPKKINSFAAFLDDSDED